MLGTERGVAGEEDVNDNAERPEVDGFGVAGGGVGVFGTRENLSERRVSGERYRGIRGGTGRGIRACPRRWSYVWWGG